MNKFGLILLSIFINFSFILPLAQAVTPDRDTRIEEAIEQVSGEREFKHKSESFYRFMPSSSAKNQDGSVGIIEAGSEYEVEFKAFGKVPVNFSLNTGYIGVNNSTAVYLPAKLTSATSDIEITLPFFKFDKTYFRFGVSPSLYGDDWNFKPSNFRIPSRYYIIRQPNEKLTYVFGVAYLPEYETEAFPIVGLIYTPNDKLTFNLIPPRPTIEYSLNNKIDLFLEGGYDGDEFIVDINHTQNQVLSYGASRVGTGINYQFNKYMQGSFAVGGTFGRSLEYRTDSFGKVVVKNGFYTEVRFVAKI